jgi:hypothetical protein
MDLQHTDKKSSNLFNPACIEARLERWIAAGHAAMAEKRAASHERDMTWPLGVPLADLRLDESAKARAFRRYPINEHKPGPG